METPRNLQLPVVLGTISSRLTLEAPIVKNKGSFVVAGRRTYADMFLKFSKNKSLQNSRLYFYDFNLKGNYTINDNNRVYLSGYFGRDAMKFDKFFEMSWGNATGTARWNHIFNSKLFLNTSLIFSNYDYALGEPEGEAAYKWTSNIKDYNGKLDFNYFLNPNNTIRFGLNSAFHKFVPGVAKGTGESVLDQFKVQDMNALEHAVYISNEQKIGTRFSASYGLRFSMFQNIGEYDHYTYDANYNVSDTTHYAKGEIFNTYMGFEPRAGLRYSLNETSAIKASYNRTRQYVQLASNSTSASPLDIWFPKFSKRKASDCGSGGFRCV